MATGLFSALAGPKALQQLVDKEPTATGHSTNCLIYSYANFNFPSSVTHNQQAWKSSLQRSFCIIFITYFFIYTSTWAPLLCIHTLARFRRQGLVFLNFTCGLTQ